MEIKRFGPGHRRPEGPPGTQGVSGQIIFSDDRAVVTELAFQRFALIAPHTNQANTALFVVISGGGFVQVGEERARVNHGEAVVWPAGEVHGAYTDGTEMRVLIVELLPANPPPPVVAHEPAGEEVLATPAEGSLADKMRGRDAYDSGEGEPW